MVPTAYPLGDVVLIFGVAVVLMRGVDAGTRPPMWLLAAASVPWVVGDAVLGYRNSHPTEAIVADWEMLCFLTAHFLLAAAAFEQCRRAGRRTYTIVDHAPIRRVGRLPYVAVVGAFGLLLFVAWKERVLYPWGGLVLCAVVLTGLVVARQVLVQQESLRMAVTDGLTGLANRVRLHEALSSALTRAARSGQTTGGSADRSQWFQADQRHLRP